MLAIAIVVDDAIVVVEAVHAKLDLGYKSTKSATVDAMNEISGAIISITLVMASVFVPVSFMGGTSGTFYREIRCNHGDIYCHICCERFNAFSSSLCGVIETS